MSGEEQCAIIWNQKVRESYIVFLIEWIKSELVGIYGRPDVFEWIQIIRIHVTYHHPEKPFFENAAERKNPNTGNTINEHDTALIEKKADQVVLQAEVVSIRVSE